MRIQFNFDIDMVNYLNQNNMPLDDTQFCFYRDTNTSWLCVEFFRRGNGRRNGSDLLIKRRHSNGNVTGINGKCTKRQFDEYFRKLHKQTHKFECVVDPVNTRENYHVFTVSPSSWKKILPGFGLAHQQFKQRHAYVDWDAIEWIQYKHQTRKKFKSLIKKYMNNPDYSSMIDPNNLYGEPEYGIDHKMSIADGYIYGVTSAEINSPENLHVISNSLNSKKGQYSYYDQRNQHLKPKLLYDTIQNDPLNRDPDNPINSLFE